MGWREGRFRPAGALYDSFTWQQGRKDAAGREANINIVLFVPRKVSKK